MDEANDRKIIQITTAPHGFSDAVFVICNDGTVWRMLTGSPYEKWKKLPPIPQPEEEHVPV